MEKKQIFAMRKWRGVLVSVLIGLVFLGGQVVAAADEFAAAESVQTNSVVINPSEEASDLATSDSTTDTLVEPVVVVEPTVQVDEQQAASDVLVQSAPAMVEEQLDSQGLGVEQTVVEPATESALPLHPTDVVTSSETTTLATIDGTFVGVEPAPLLERINAIRQEAYDEGLVESYVPLKWSTDLEKIAQIRAAEATFKQSHTRPNDSYTFTTTVNGLQASGENLAWNFRRTASSTVRATEQFYEEKPDYLTYLKTDTAPDQIGHYITLINPYYRYVGIATFYTDAGHFFTTTAQEFATEEDLRQTQTKLSGRYRQQVEVSASNTTDVALTLSSNKLNVGDTGTAYLAGNLLVSGFQSGIIPTTFTDFKWTSSDPTVVSIDSSGHFLGKSAGQATLSANLAGVIYSQALSVRAIKPIAALERYISSLDQLNLPETIEAIWTDGTISQEVVTWESNPDGFTTKSISLVGHLTNHPITVRAIFHLVEKTSKPQDIEPIVQLESYQTTPSHLGSPEITLSASPQLPLVAVYQLRNPQTGETLYTTNVFEKRFLEAIGWIYQGIAWYAPTAGQPVYRLYHSILGYHLYSESLDDIDKLKEQGWQVEGVAWYY